MLIQVPIHEGNILVEDSLQEQLEIPQTQHLPCRTLAEPRLSYHLELVDLSPTPSSAWLQHGWSAAFAQSPASLLCGHSVGLECMCLCMYVDERVNTSFKRKVQKTRTYNPVSCSSDSIDVNVCPREAFSICQCTLHTHPTLLEGRRGISGWPANGFERKIHLGIYKSS